jgi:hypothetical protein
MCATIDIEVNEEMHEQTTTNRPAIQDGDVLEIDGPDGAVTALVLLANAKMVILDLCDDSTPVVIERHSLRPYRVFSDALLAAVA